MRCYRCESVLSETDYCNSCGADVAVYKKIIKLSNSYYNMGLEKAHIRDLSGAADFLRRSVRMNKKNIKARNLLGLVYYEMGEFVEALSQWVISKNIQHNKNVADEYLKEVQSNPTRLEAMNLTIKKYNAALGYAMDGSDDLAIIQLKKVVNLNPKFIKAYQLFALMYMKKEDYVRAKKLIKKSLEIDYNNTLSIKYLNEIERITQKSSSKNEKKVEERKELSGNDVIIPTSSYKDVNYGVMQFVTIIIGILIGAAMVYFLITPAKENNAISEYKETINEYSNSISKLNLSITEFQNQLNEAEKEKESLQAQIVEAGQQEKLSEGYKKLFEAMTLFVNDDKINCALKLLEIEDVSEQNEEFTALYNALKDKSFTEAYKSSYNTAYQAENANKLEDAIESFLICEKFQPNNVEVLYHLAKSYRMLNNGVADEKSKSYYRKVVELEPNSQFAGWSKQYVD